MRTALFCVITQPVVGIYFTDVSGQHRLLKMESIGCPETSVRNYHYTLRNDPEERSS